MGWSRGEPGRGRLGGDTRAVALVVRCTPATARCPASWRIRVQATSRSRARRRPSRTVTQLTAALGRALSTAAGAGELLLRPAALVSRSQGQGAVLRETAHRPWPPPREPWLMAQTWEDLLFAHWPVPAERLRPLLPDVIPIDERDGSAWIGVTPFRVSAFRLRGMPHLPGVTTFPELNVRTYT